MARSRDHFRDRSALVTGAGSGIGAALSRALVARGARVWAADLRPDGVEALAEGHEAITPLTLDVTDADALRGAVDRVCEEAGRIDLLFNNAGIGVAGEVRDTPLQDWRKVFEVNLMGVVNGIEAAYPRMIAQGDGHIVNTASGAGLLPRPGMAAYAASKHAVVGLSTSLRAEAAALGVRVTAVCPGYIGTGIMDRTEYRALDADALTRDLPLKPISPEDCASQVLTAVVRNRGIVVVSRALHLEWWVWRLSPRLAEGLVAIRAKRFRQSRRPS